MILRINNTFDDGGVYVILNTVTNQRYVGMTGNFRLRWRSHIDDLSKGIHSNSLLQYDWDRFGKDAFTFKILEKVASKRIETLKERERVWFRRLDVFSAKGYNLAR